MDKEFPDGTACFLAKAIKFDPNISISFFNNPLAEVAAMLPRLFEHTNSAKSPVVCAPVCFWGAFHIN